MVNKDLKIVTKVAEDLMKENEVLRRTIDKKDSTIKMYMNLNVEKNEKIMELQEGVNYSKSKSAGILSKLGHIINSPIDNTNQEE